jgi:uncharacterized protein (TIGR02598 family)
MFSPLVSKFHNPLHTHHVEGSQEFERGGFSLVEVTIAVGLTMFALLVVFSLMPMGLSVMLDSQKKLIKTEIYSLLEAELSSTPFGDLDRFVADRFPLYFDNEGNEVSGAADAIFIVRCRLSAAQPLPNMRRAIFSVGRNTDPDTNPQNASRRGILLVDQGF